MLFPRDELPTNFKNFSPVVSICSIICLIVAIISVVGRTFTKAAVVRRLSMDDYTMFSATIFAAGQTGTVLSASANGLGRQSTTLNKSQRIAFEKAIYASGFLFILSLVLSKISVVLFIRGLGPIAILRKPGYVLGAFFLAWGLGSLFAVGFQCTIPNTWQMTENTCMEIRSFWISFDIINVLTEVALVAWPVSIISRLHTGRKRRAVFIVCFASRILVIGAAIVQIAYIFRQASSSRTNLTFDLWPLTVCNQIVQCMTIFTTCIPYLQPFLLSLESGLLRADELRRQIMKDDSASSAALPNLTSRNKPLLTSEASKTTVLHPSEAVMLPAHTARELREAELGTSWSARVAHSQQGVETIRNALEYC